jgi:prepilin-type processing-associated H-X9-DG protein
VGRTFKTVQGRQLAHGAAQVGRPLPEEPDMTPPILESVSVWFVDGHVVAIMGQEMPPPLLGNLFELVL